MQRCSRAVHRGGGRLMHDCIHRGGSGAAGRGCRAPSGGVEEGEERRAGYGGVSLYFVH